MPDDLELKQLNNFYGTEQYYDVLGILVTDGVKYIMDNGYSWFVTDSIAVIITKFKNSDFLAVKLKINDNKAVMNIEDGNYNILYTQKYDYTNCKRDLILYYTNNVLMLNKEY